MGKIPSNRTEVLYLLDPLQTTFTAKIIDHTEISCRPAVVLDRTAFYPTGGGQPHDTGTINGVPVVDVFLSEQDGQIWHVLEQPVHKEQVEGIVDWERRLDHMQQHTGQHILSEAFWSRLDATTVSFHLGEEISTIDLDQIDIQEEQLQAVEEAANRTVFQNLPITARFVTGEELAHLPLRKPPSVEGPIRVVEVESYDWSACGGTHCHNSCQVGLIHIVGAERRGESTRISFLCGRRALEDYRRKDRVLSQVAGFLTTGYLELPHVIQKMEAEARTQARELQRLRESLASAEAHGLLAQAEGLAGFRLVKEVFENREVSEIKIIAGRLLEAPGTIILFGWKGPQKGQILIARSNDVGLDAPDILRAVCAVVGGGGGGRPELAQGGGMPSSRIDEALDLARKNVVSQLEARAGS